MKSRCYLWGAALAISVVLTVIGLATGAAVLVGLATAIELVVSIATGKKKNV